MKQYYNQLAEQVSISTSDSFLIVWKVFINFCSFIIYFEISLELFNVEEFQKDNRGEIFFIWRIVILTLLLADMIINLFIEYINTNGITIEKPYNKVKYYFRHYFIYDAIVIVYLFVSTFIALPFWVGFLVFFRIPSNVYSDRITEEYLIQYQFLLLVYKILKLLVILLYIFDIFACAFYAMGLHSISLGLPTWLEYSDSVIGNIDKMHHLTQFIISYFWAVETLVSMGYGEITPMNQHEIMIADIALVGCMFLCLYVISNIISFQQDNTSYLDESLISIRQFMIVKKVSKKTYNEISIFLSQFRNEQAQRDLQLEQIVFQRLPNQLKTRLFYEANQRIISQISWIKNNFSEEFILELSNHFHEQYLNANTKIDVVDINDEPKIFVIEKGKIEIFLNGILIYELCKGDHFGSFSFFTKENEQFITYKTKSIVILYYIKYSDFFELAQNFQIDQEKLFYIRDQVIFENNFQLIDFGCYICSYTDHQTEKCSIISIKDQIFYEVRKNQSQGSQQDRSQFIRQQKKQNVQYGLKKNKDLVPVFHTCLGIDSKVYSILQYRWKPISKFKQPIMKIHLSMLIKDSLLQQEIVQIENKIKWKKSSIFSSSNQYLFYWQLFMMVINAFFFIAVPQIIFFWDQYDYFSDHGVFKGMRTFIILIFIIDFICQFNINYYNEGILIRNRFKIAYHYLKNNLLFDLIPILVLFYMSISDKYVLVYLLCLVKLIPFYRFQFYLSDKLKILPNLRQIYLIAGMLIEILYINHFFGCMFYAAGVYMYTYHPTSKTWVNDSSMNFGVIITKSTPSKYLFSTYWAIDAITRIGYGDILPLNDLEFMITDITVILAVAIVAVNISFIENMRKSSKFQNYFSDNLWIQLYLQKKKCSKDLKQSISNYLRYYHRVGQDRNVEIEQEALQLLPANLKMQLMFEAYGSIFNKQPWLKNQNILFEISNKAKEVYLGDSENIFLDNIIDQNQALYFIDRGQIELFINIQQSNKRETMLAILKNDNFFGHYTFITGLPRKCSARTKIFASLIYVKRKDFQDVLELNYAYHQEIETLKNSIIYDKRFQMIGLQCFTCHQGDHLSVDCPLTSIKHKLLLGLQHNLREKSQSEINLRKLLKPNQTQIQKRLFHLRKKKIRTKTFKIPQKVFPIDYEQPRMNINFVIDKDLQILQ